jgi:hypothetical protein
VFEVSGEKAGQSEQRSLPIFFREEAEFEFYPVE